MFMSVIVVHDFWMASTQISEQNIFENTIRWWLNFGANELLDRCLVHHFRSTSRNNCEYCIFDNQIRERCYSERFESFRSASTVWIWSFAGDKESTKSFIAISIVIFEALSSIAVSNAAIQLFSTRDVASLFNLKKYIDFVIFRNSNELVRYVKNNIHIFVFEHVDDFCNIYMHADADVKMIVKIFVNAKVSYSTICNVIKTLFVHEDTFSFVFFRIAEAFFQNEVSLRCDAPFKVALFVSFFQHQFIFLQNAIEKDFNIEFFDFIFAIKTIFASFTFCDLVIAHINVHSSFHTNVIIIFSRKTARRFQISVNSVCVLWNTNTRMSNEMRFDFDIEVGISTNKIHVRGSVGLKRLLIYKYLLSEEGQMPGKYFDGFGGRTWKHERLEIENWDWRLNDERGFYRCLNEKSETDMLQAKRKSSWWGYGKFNVPSFLSCSLLPPLDAPKAQFLIFTLSNERQKYQHHPVYHVLSCWPK